MTRVFCYNTNIIVLLLDGPFSSICLVFFMTRYVKNVFVKVFEADMSESLAKACLYISITK